MPSRSSALFLSLVLTMFVAGPASAGDEVSVSRIEVTQSVQKSDDSVPLIAHKPTMVRAYPSYQEFASIGFGFEIPVLGSVAQVNGTLSVNGGPPINAINGPISVIAWWPAFPILANSSLNFPIAFPPDGNVSLTVTISSGEPDVQPPIANVTFVHTERIRIAAVPLDFDHDDDPTTAPTKMAPAAQVADGDEWMLKAGPFAPCKVFYNPIARVEITQDLSAVSTDAVLATLAAMQVQGTVTYDQVAGWWQGSVNGNGRSQLPDVCTDPIGIGTYSNTEPSRYQRTFAHEIFHNYYQVHTGLAANAACNALSSTDPDTIGVVGWDTALNQPVPPDKFDVMRGGQLTAAAWVAPARYTTILGHFTPAPPETLFDACHANWWRFFRDEYLPFGVAALQIPLADQLVVSGIVVREGGGRLLPAWRLTRQTPPPLENPEEGRWAVELLDHQGLVLQSARFTPIFHSDSEGEDAEAGFFFRFPLESAPEPGPFGAPLPAGIVPSPVAEIRLLEDGKPIDSIHPGDGAPEVQLLEPLTGKLEGFVPIGWSASDPDQDPLSFAILYSPDAGKQWISVASGIGKLPYLLNADELPGSSDARLAVLATDGLHTSMSASGGPYAVARRAPKVHIHSPGAGPDGPTTLSEGDALVLSGNGHSPDDGRLPGEQLEWFSDRDGALFAGYTGGVELSQGDHVITLVGTDKAGSQGSATTEVRVLPQGADRDGDGVPDDADACPDKPYKTPSGCSEPSRNAIKVKFIVTDSNGNMRRGNAFDRGETLAVSMRLKNATMAPIHIETLHLLHATGATDVLPDALPFPESLEPRSFVDTEPVLVETKQSDPTGIYSLVAAFAGQVIGSGGPGEPLAQAVLMLKLK